MTDDKNIVKFPENRQKQEKEWRKAYRADHHEPFLNVGQIPVFTRYITAAIVVISAAVLVLNMTRMVPDILYHASFALGFVPETWTQGNIGLLTLLTPVTHAFVHGGFVHLAFNSIMLLALGTLFERRFGAQTTAVFFFACVAAGAVTFYALAPNTNMPVIGASGGVSGLFSAALMIMQTMRPVPAKFGGWGIVGAWLVIMLGIGTLSGSNIAWQSHLGGYVCGAGMYWWLTRQRA